VIRVFPNCDANVKAVNFCAFQFSYTPGPVHIPAFTHRFIQNTATTLIRWFS